MSDVPALVWATAAIYLAWTCEKSAWRPLLAGVATAIAVLIRPSNVLCAFPIAICLAGHWRNFALWIVGGLPLALWQGWLNQTLYGSIFASGYGDIRTMIGGEFFLPTLRSYALWLPVLFTPLICLAPVAPWLRSIPARTRLILVVWAAPIFLFYSFYWCTWDHWCGMRFVLPAAPALVVLGTLALQHVVSHLRLRVVPLSERGRLVAGTLCLVLLLGSLVADSFRKDLLYWLHANREHAVVANWVRTHAPADAIVLANHGTGSMMYYTSLTCIRVDFIHQEAGADELFAQLSRSERPVFAVFYHSDAPGPDGFIPRPDAWGLAGVWRKVASPWPDGATVWQLQPVPPVVGSGALLGTGVHNAFSSSGRSRF